jgi:glycosyltransferase involved in cell wall biosynthesis
MNALPSELPWVSLVTPAYNQANFLAGTIESVLAQDYPKLEYIVLDDGSSDDTPAVLRRFDGRIRHDRHTNVGQARTLNRGWAMARGALIGYLSSDDRLRPCAVRRLVETLIKQPEAVLAYCDFELIDAKGRAFRTVQAEDYDANRLRLDLVCQPGPGALFRRAIFDASGGWAEELRQVPDFEFWLRASHFGPFVRVPEVLAQYRIHEGSASFRPLDAQRSLEIVEVIHKYWGGRTGPEVDRSVAAAHTIAAKNHFQSGRPIAGLSQWLAALRHRPATVLSPSTWRMLLSGLLRRVSHRLLGRDS